MCLFILFQMCITSLHSEMNYLNVSSFYSLEKIILYSASDLLFILLTMHGVLSEDNIDMTHAYDFITIRWQVVIFKELKPNIWLLLELLLMHCESWIQLDCANIDKFLVFCFYLLTWCKGVHILASLDRKWIHSRAVSQFKVYFAVRQ